MSVQPDEEPENIEMCHTVSSGAVPESSLFDLSHTEHIQCEAVASLLEDFSDVVSLRPMDVCTTTVVQHEYPHNL